MLLEIYERERFSISFFSKFGIIIEKLGVLKLFL